jgi:hypothetical protein
MSIAALFWTLLAQTIGGLTPTFTSSRSRASSRARAPHSASARSGCTDCDALGPDTPGEDVGARIAQLIPHGSLDQVDAQSERAQEQDCLALCLAVDAPVQRRDRGDAGAARRAAQAAFTWKQLEQCRQRIRVPLLLKGITTAQDALLACEHGVDVIYVSNHGGRGLDHGRDTAAVLPEISTS